MIDIGKGRSQSHVWMINYAVLENPDKIEKKLTF